MLFKAIAVVGALIFVLGVVTGNQIAVIGGVLLMGVAILLSQAFKDN